MAVKTFNIFRAGTHKAMAGQVLDFSEQDIQRMAGAYNEATRPAPLVLGHPKTEDAAYGTVKGLFAKGGLLYAVADVADSLIGMVRGGSYKNVSSAFFAPRAEGNPVPSSYYLRHVGFLGAVAPAVKNLNKLAFSEGADLCFADSGHSGFAQPLDAGVDLDSEAGRRVFDQAARALVSARPGLSYAEAANTVNDQVRSRSFGARGVTVGPERQATHAAVLSFQEAVTGATYAEAITQLRASGMSL